MKSGKIFVHRRGFSLVLLILIFSALAVMVLAGAMFGARIKTISSDRRSINRMMVIRDAAGKFFRSHEYLPPPAGTDETPVGPQALNLTQEHRQDAWGRALAYYIAPNITGVAVDGQAVGGYILSGGPNQTVESTLTAGSITTTGDDLLVPINVQAEAIEIALFELEMLAKKICTYQCAGYSLTAPLFLADPVGVIRATYSLGDTFRTDPWQNTYAWAPLLTRFYSFGPDRTDDSQGGDDIKVAVLAFPSACCPSYSPPPPAPSAGWNFNEGTGNTVAGAGGPDGTRHGGANWLEETPEASSSAMRFNGVDGYVEIPAAPALNLDTTKLSISIWVKFTDVNTQTQPILRKWLSADGGWGSYTIHRLAGNIISGNIQNMNLGQYPSWTTNASISAGYWHHIVFVYKKDKDGDGHVGSDDGKVYIDGREEAVTFNPSPGGYTDSFSIQYCDLGHCNLYIGRQAAPAWSEFYNGYVDQADLYDVDLTAEQVKAIYESSAVARYIFQGDTLDQSPHGNDGTTYPAAPNGPLFVSDRFGDADRALSFDGANDYMDLGTDGSLNFRSNLPGVIRGGFTVCAWFKTLENSGPLVSFRDTSANGAPVINLTVGYNGVNYQAGRLRAMVRGDHGAPWWVYAAIDGPVVNDGDWHYAVLTRGELDAIDLYLDGFHLGSTTGISSHQSITTNRRALAVEPRWLADGQGTVDARWFNGVLDDVVIFPRNISPSEIESEWCEYCAAIGSPSPECDLCP